MKVLLHVRSLVLSAALSPAFAAQTPTTSDANALVSLASDSSALRRISSRTIDLMLGVPRKKSSPDRSLSREAVEVMLGIPGAKLSPNVWVYWNCKVEDIPACEPYNTLIIEFTEDRVSFVRFGRSEPVRTFIAQLQIAAFKTDMPRNR